MLEPVNINEMTRKQIFKLFRKNDESHLWPISNKFNATERAIRQLKKFERDYGQLEGLELFLTLDSNISTIVNNKV
jgi:hypothetical protein